MPLLRVLGKGFKSVAKTLCLKTREAATAIGPVNCRIGQSWAAVNTREAGPSNT
jgi:hypothetical protein